MAQLGRIEITVQDVSGNKLSGIAVEVRRQGAQVNGAQAGPLNTITVDAPNGCVAGDTVKIGTGATTRSVSSVTATTVVVGGPGFASVSDDDRITIVSALPTIYEDAEGTTTIANPLTTDSLGKATCYVVGGMYDVQLSGAAITTTLLQDQISVGGESIRSNIYMSGTAVMWILDSLRAAAAGDTLFDLRTAGVSKFKVMGDGEIVAGATGATHVFTGTLTSSGALTVQAGGAAITGNSTIAGTLGGLTGLTVDSGGASITGNSTVGGVALTSSGVTMTNLSVNSISNGQNLTFRTQTELLTIAAAATTDSFITLNTNAVILAVSVRVTTAIPTAATFTVTGATTGTTFSTAAVAVAAGSTNVGTASCPYKNDTAQLVRITPNLTPANNTGRVRVTIHYYDVTPATS